jgi:hypothetical protein
LTIACVAAVAAGGLLSCRLAILVLARIGLPIRERVAARRAAEFVGRATVSVRSTASVLRVVLPITSATCRLLARSVAVAYVLSVAVTDVLPVGIPDEVIVVVDVDIVVTAAPTVTTAPTTSAPKGSHGDANAEGDRHSCCVVADRRIDDGRICVDRSAIDDRGIVAGHINHFRTGLLDNDDLLALDCLDFDLLLLGRLQVALVLSDFAHMLHGSHYIVLLREERVPQVGGPLDVLGQQFDYLG